MKTIKQDSTVKRKKKTGQPGQDARASIISKSMGLFSRRGYNGVSLRDIAKACDIHVSSLYYYYPTKALIYSECLSAAVSFVADISVQPIQNTQNPVEGIRNYISGVISIVSTDSPEFGLLDRELEIRGGAHSELISREIRKKTNELKKKLVELFAAYLPKAVDRDRTERLTAMMFGMVYGAVKFSPLYVSSSGSSLTEKTIEDDLLYIFAAAIAGNTLSD